MSDTHKSRKKSRFTDAKKNSPPYQEEEKLISTKKRDIKEASKSGSEGRNMDETSVKVVLDETNFPQFPEIGTTTIKNLVARGIKSLFPIQLSTFRAIYEGNDIIARDLTGSGKTLAFCLPLVEKFRKMGYYNTESYGRRKLLTVILAPTRELAIQVSKELKALRNHENEYKVITVYGGVSIDNQTRELRNGVEFFVGTTGRVMDHIKRGNIDFSSIKTVCLDEADQMLNMGFQEDVEFIMASVSKAVTERAQFLLFSATVPHWVKDVARKYLDPKYIFMDLVKDLKNKTSKTVQHLAINCPYFNRTATLADVLLCYGGLHGKTIVFAQTKADANDVLLADKVKLDVEVLHGDIAQNQREVTLQRFRDNKFNVLVATDVASRGLDIPNVDLVIQLEPPKDVETYIHRSGRTGRAGLNGICITFYGKKHQGLISMIENKAGVKLKKIGAPQPEEIIKSSAKQVIKGFEKVDHSVLPLFEDTAKQLIESKGALEAVSLALAYISGTMEKIKARSMLTGQEKFISFNLQTDAEFNGVSYVWGILRRLLPQDIVDGIRGMRMHNDKKGAIFDIDEHHADRVIDLYQNEVSERRQMSYTLEVAKTLPDLFEQDVPMGGFGGSRGGFGGGRGSFGGRSGGFSRGRGGGGSRGGYGRPQSSFGGFGGGRGGNSSGSNGYSNGGSSYGRSNGYNTSNGGGGRSNGYSSGGRSNGYSGGSKDSYKKDRY